MNIAVITCQKYSDCWAPFIALFGDFWRDCPYPVQFYSDESRLTWCEVVALMAEAADEPVLMLLDDFFLTAPVHQSLVEHGLELLRSTGAGCVRLFPMPGGEGEFPDPYFARIPKGTRSRISTMAAIWRPDYLRQVARGAMTTTSEAGDFENLGTPYAEGLDAEVLAFRRDVRPWPLEHMTSAVDRGLWNPDAIRLCEQMGIPLDRSMRQVAQ